MPRAIWTGSIAFGLVNVPVRMYSAIHEESLHFNLVHAEDRAPIGYAKVCKAEGREVADEEIVRAYPVGDDELVLLDDEDFAAAAAERYRTIEILDFVPAEQIDPIYFERTYYLGPDRDAGAVYALLTAAMERSELAAIARFVFHDRERLAALRVREGVIALERLHYPDEVRPVEGVAPERRPKVDRRQLDMAVRLIEQQATDFDPSRYHDVYRERLLEVIHRKARGETVEVAPPKAPEETGDLMEALRASLERAKAGKGGARDAGGDGGERAARKGRGREKEDALADLTVAELRERAREAGVRGRSKMDRKQLIAALRDAA